MRKLLWVGDAGVPSGFALATHKTLDVLRETWDVTVLGMNYRGDPHPYPYPIYAAGIGGDGFGVGRLIWMCDLLDKPDAIIIQNDPWNIPFYLHQLKQFECYADVPVIASMPVDGLNCKGRALNDLALAIFWTHFGEDEARRGGFTGRSAIVPLGVDTTIFTPGDRIAARKALGLPREYHRAFVVGVVGRNQLRKRLDLAVRYFAKWIEQKSIDDAWLFLHVGPTGDMGFDVEQLARYYGIVDRLMLREPPVFYGVPDTTMAQTYRALDIFLSTTQGEGWGLPAMEAMACGIPCILPDWAAYGEWAREVACLVPCTSTAVTVGGPNAIGGVADEAATIAMFHTLYENEKARLGLAQAGLALANRPEYQWRAVGEAFRDAVDMVVASQRKLAAV